MEDNILIKEEEFLSILSNYYTKKFGKETKIYNRLHIINKDGVEDLKMDLFYVYEQKSTRAYIRLENYLELNDVIEALEDYAHQNGFELETFNYIGGIKHREYFNVEDEPYFVGALIVKKHELKKELK